MNDKINILFENINQIGWAYSVFSIVFLTLIAAFSSGKIVNILHNKFLETDNLIDDAIVISIKKPLKFLIWIVGLSFAVETIYKESGEALFAAIYPIRDVAIVSTISWFIIRFIKEIQNNVIEGKEKAGEEVDRTTIGAIGKILRASVIITSILIILQTLGFSISGVLAFGGVGGIAIGFAAKDLLANFFGALMIYFDRPFKVGDWIRSPDKEIEGTVEEIGWRLTRIRTFDKRPLYVPNSAFATISVENPSRMTNRRIYETLGVRYDDMAKVQAIVKQTKEMLQNHKDIAQDQTMIVNVDAFAPSSVDFFVYIFTKTTDWIKFHEIKQDVMLKIANIIDDNQAEIAFPTTTIHIPDAIKTDKI